LFYKPVVLLVLHRCDTWTLALKGNYKLELFDGPWKDEIIYEWVIL